MAWTYRSRRYSSRTVRRSFRRRRVAGSRYRRRYRRGRRSRKTTSAYVTLTQNAQWTLFADATGGDPRKWNAFVFSPASVPGFMDYQATYSHFRILKCKLYMARTIGDNTGANFNYLIVGSRPFAAVQAPGNQNSGPSALVPPQLETDLRQAKWQKIRNPSTISQVVPIRIPSLYHDPDQWAIDDWIVQSIVATHLGGQAMDALHLGSGAERHSRGLGGIAFYGPYVVVDGYDGNIPGTFSGKAVECTLRLTVQFRGQR